MSRTDEVSREATLMQIPDRNESHIHNRAAPAPGPQSRRTVAAKCILMAALLLPPACGIMNAPYLFFYCTFGLWLALAEEL